MKTLRTKSELFEIANKFRIELKGTTFDSESRIYVLLFKEDIELVNTEIPAFFEYTPISKLDIKFPVAEFSNLNKEKITICLDGRSIEGDLEIFSLIQCMK